jgi:hypothetical protein
MTHLIASQVWHLIKSNRKWYPQGQDDQWIWVKWNIRSSWTNIKKIPIKMANGFLNQRRHFIKLDKTKWHPTYLGTIIVLTYLPYVLTMVPTYVGRVGGYHNSYHSRYYVWYLPTYLPSTYLPIYLLWYLGTYLTTHYR